MVSKILYNPRPTGIYYFGWDRRLKENLLGNNFELCKTAIHKGLLKHLGFVCLFVCFNVLVLGGKIKSTERVKMIKVYYMHAEKNHNEPLHYKISMCLKKKMCWPFQKPFISILFYFKLFQKAICN
jgi:hypothetical protein